MDNWVTIYGLCELLFFRDTTIASEVETASDAELLVDFLLLVCLIYLISVLMIANLPLVGTS